MADDVTKPGNADNNEYKDIPATPPLRRLSGKVLLERLKTTPIVNHDLVKRLKQQIKDHNFAFNDDQVANKFLELEKILNG